MTTQSSRPLALLVACAALVLSPACDSASSPDDVVQDGDPANVPPDGGSSGQRDATVSTPADAGQAGPDAGPGTFTPPEGPWFPCSAQDSVGAVIVPAHQGVAQFFSGWDPGQNTRNVDAVADFPAEGTWSSVYLRVELGCPDGGGCDFWDRAASFALVEGEGEAAKPIELARHMTPYGVSMCFLADVTDFAGRLHGKQTIRSFIDTWVGPGHAQGDGWKVTSTFLLRSEASAADTVELVPLWNNQAEDRIVDLGEPTKPLETELPTRTVLIPADAARVELRYLVTGHGQGNQNNCAEFCPLDYTTRVGSEPVSLTPWRGDCPNNPLSEQYGTWKYPRAGWCPGALVLPQVVDITALVTPGAEQTFSFEVRKTNGEAFVNSCRPGAGDAQNACSGCGAGGPDSCDYNSNGHTPPQARLSVQLLVHR